MIKIKIEIPNPDEIYVGDVKYIREVHESPKHISLLNNEAGNYEKEIVKLTKKIEELQVRANKRRFSITRYEKLKEELKELRAYKPAVGSEDLEKLKKECFELEELKKTLGKKEPVIRGVKEAKELLNDALIEMKSLGDAIPIKSYSKFSDIQAKIRQSLNILLGK